jgi:hypothetical protein
VQYKAALKRKPPLKMEISHTICFSSGKRELSHFSRVRVRNFTCQNLKISKVSLVVMGS